MGVQRALYGSMKVHPAALARHGLSDRRVGATSIPAALWSVVPSLIGLLGAIAVDDPRRNILPETIPRALHRFRFVTI